MIHENFHLGLTEHFSKYLFADAGLVIPAKRLSESGQIVLRAYPEIKFLGVAADHFLFAEIGARQSACGHSAEMVAGFEQNDYQAFASSRYRRDDSPGCSAVYDEVGSSLGKRATRRKNQERRRE